MLELHLTLRWKMNRVQEDKAAGAYVMEPKQGLHEWVYDLDLTSMYPSTIMTLNISPETKLGKLEGWNAEEFVKGVNKKLTLRGRETGITSFSFNNVFPSGTDKYYINIYPKTGTTLGSSIPTVIPHYTIEQYANPVLTITATETNDFFTAPANITYTGRPNAFPNKLKHISSIKEFFSIKPILTIVRNKSQTELAVKL